MNREKHSWIYDVFFLLVLVLAGYLRLTGVNWGEGQHQHPDELHFTSVLESLRAQKCADETIAVDACPDDQKQWLGIGDYLNSKTSTLNQYNRGFSFYVYGNLPMTITRIAAEATNQTNFKLFGRQMSALADLFAILFLYLVASRLYGRKVGLLTALFSSLAVMQIQQSHFFTVDLFVNTFEILAIYFAVAILDARHAGMEKPEASIANPQSLITNYASRFISEPLFLLSIGFGIAFGMALASKVNIIPLAVLLPGAFALRYFITDHKRIAPSLPESEDTVNRRSLITDYWLLIATCLIAGGLAAFISFRIFQPYAFDGIGLNQQWIDNLTEQRAQATGEADLPWNLQWARRSHLYSFENLTTWGLGLPLGILAWLGFLYMGWRILKGEWRHALVWGWTAIYFLWQSMQFNPTMRYQLPIYPMLAMIAAWAVLDAPKRFRFSRPYSAIRIGMYAIGGIVLVLTALWAFAFQSIYTREEPRIGASRWIFENIPGPINVQIQKLGDATYSQPLPFPTGGFIEAGQPYDTTFTAQSTGIIDSVILGHAANTLASSSTLNLLLSEVPNPTPEQALTSASLTTSFAINKDLRGDRVTLKFNKPIAVTEGEQYYLRFELDLGTLVINGDNIANETDYDYTLPFRVDGYDAFGGIYRGDLLLQVYWDDNEEKLERFVTTLDQTDYILIPTNHQYAQISRVPERYPLTALYYRELMGCPLDVETIPCYHEANPGDYKGRLGFDLVAVFTDYPKLGSFEINDQYAEEAFTFYDHPKAFIFKKNADFDSEQVRSVLGTVDLSKVVRLLPRQFDDYSTLLLPADKLAGQRAGGTWSQLFDYEWIQNKYPALGLVIWYLFIFILGLAMYPLTRLAMPGLADKGYPLSRALGVLLLGYLSWMAGSFGIPYTRLTITVVFGIILVSGAVVGRLQRNELIEEWKTKRKYFLMAEGLFLAFFLIDFLIRLGNPDLWHPSFGGERPMDFSYFNAVIKSTSFPPYDPWFAGGYINYYYYGFVLVGTPVKLLGIVPSIAYNFILPTLFGLVGIGAFSIGWNLLSPLSQRERAGGDGDDSPFTIHPSSFVAGLSATFLTLLLGNLGTLQTVYNKLQQLGAPGVFNWDSTLVQRLTWATEGLKMVIKGSPLPIGNGEWYWLPSRVVPPGPDNSITEFPLFTFIYSDLHAHMIAMFIMLLALSWALAVVAGKARWKNQVSAGLGFVIGGLVIGALYPTNLSDMYTYLPIGLAALVYSVWRYSEESSTVKKLLLVIGAILALTVLSFVMYQPYRDAYSQAYSALDPWKGPFTPIMSYLTQWSLFLFVIVSWMIWETREWMASTPISSLRKLKPYALLIEGVLAAIVLAMIIFQFWGVWDSDVPLKEIQHIGTSVGWIALPVAVWAGILLLRPNMPDAKRMVLFLIGTALLITIVVEVAAVNGDIGRQNTIFKFYLQAWFLLAVSAGAALAWTLPAFFKWLPGWRVFWQVMMILLISGAASFTVTGIMGKIKDRWILEAPRTLDAMTFMKFANYDDFDHRLDLSEDYNAIRWMQDNVQGSPVLVEANCGEYRWCTRFTIYTGLPGVVGWNWHQRQQRVFNSIWVEDRVREVDDFYNNLDIESTRLFLKQYDVKYIIVGQLERAKYTPDGIAKFEQFDGTYWRTVYQDGKTAIYEVIP